MKNSIMFLFIVLCILILTSCGVNAEPIENPELDEFTELYVGEDFTILVRSDIDPDTLYIKISYGYGFDNQTCSVGQYERLNYMFNYKDNYYDIVEFNKFKLINCDDLLIMGVTGEDYVE